MIITSPLYKIYLYLDFRRWCKHDLISCAMIFYRLRSVGGLGEEAKLFTNFLFNMFQGVVS
jgi:hypothetical protein